MKNTFVTFSILFTLLLASCEGTSTATSLLVLEKGQSSNNKEYWIEVLDSNNPHKEETFKIMIKEKTVWNLVEEGKEYFVRYSDNGNNPRMLEDIQH
ncbi:hypothetical protein CSV74_05820 [Sporosarcina sp. P19]|uniref:hypothetical protein n=1 Tax=Sporosarcina sp. P19 TaxID=2048258 RepID=UPI000C17067B|nr:hypothetical protein [Sporosarcina sp. P19]PIC77597.1 hypothetical protein CSV74_05820 [Sporosarcina sp. P19]